MTARPGEAAVKRAMRASMTADARGCSFVGKMTGEKGSVLWLIDPDPLEPADLDAFLDGAAGTNCAGIIVFPRTRTLDEVVAICTTLHAAGAGRWKLGTVPWKDPAPCDDVLLSLAWTTSEKHTSIALGLGPFTSMPPHRRTPFVALALWPGTYANRFRAGNRKTGRVGFIDMPVSTKTREAMYDSSWEKSRRLSRELRELDPRHAAARPDVTFCVPALAAAVASKTLGHDVDP